MHESCNPPERDTSGVAREAHITRTQPGSIFGRGPHIPVCIGRGPGIIKLEGRRAWVPSSPALILNISRHGILGRLRLPNTQYWQAWHLGSLAIEGAPGCWPCIYMGLLIMSAAIACLYTQY